MKMHHYLKKIGTWLLPYSCLLCGGISARMQDLCAECFNEMPILLNACQRCARPLPSSQDNLICGQCLTQSPPMENTYALYVYQPPITRLITDLKFGHALLNARLLGELLAEKIQSEWYRNKSLPEAIIPMPLHRHRLKERGFNQAVEIARPIGKLLQLPVETSACQRVKHTAAQATLLATQRKSNVKDAFHIRTKLTYRHVAVLDDVMTTGFTMVEFCRILEQAGVEKIDVWCCARPEM